MSEIGAHSAFSVVPGHIISRCWVNAIHAFGLPMCVFASSENGVGRPCILKAAVICRIYISMKLSERGIHTPFGEQVRTYQCGMEVDFYK
jgi:hypothetical protein